MIGLRNYTEKQFVDSTSLIVAMKTAIKRENRIGKILKAQVVDKKKTSELELEGQGDDAQKSVSHDAIA